MAKTSGTTLSELMTIRDILMGEIINEYNERFEILEKALADQQAALAAKEQELSAKIAALDGLLQEKSADLSNDFESKRVADRQALGELFQSLAQQLKD